MNGRTSWSWTRLLLWCSAGAARVATNHDILKQVFLCDHKCEVRVPEELTIHLFFKRSTGRMSVVHVQTLCKTRRGRSSHLGLHKPRLTLRLEGHLTVLLNVLMQHQTLTSAYLIFTHKAKYEQRSFPSKDLSAVFFSFSSHTLASQRPDTILISRFAHHALNSII